MDIEDLNKDDLVILLNTIKSGMAFEDALKVLIPSSQRNIVETLHTLYCRKSHGTEVGTLTECQFYKEKDWNGEDHINWLNKVSTIITDYKTDATTLSKLIPFLCEVEEIRKDVLASHDKKGLDVFNKLITLYNLPQ